MRSLLASNWVMMSGCNEESAEIILETAVFWGSRAEWNAKRNCEICDVIGQMRTTTM